MALPNPRGLPPKMRYGTSSFRPSWIVETSRTNGGLLQAVEYGDPYWTCSFTSPPKINSLDLLEIRTWWDSLEGGLFSFLAHDPARPYPRAYPDGFDGMNRAGGGAFDGTGDITAIAARKLTITTLPAGFTLQDGDYVGLEQNNRWSLHRIVEDAVANGSGAVTDLTVVPPIKTSLFDTFAKANFDKALVELVPDISSWSGDPSARVTTVSFSGMSKVQ